jgi:hypothetical protein
MAMIGNWSGGPRASAASGTIAVRVKSSGPLETWTGNAGSVCSTLILVPTTRLGASCYQ